MINISERAAEEIVKQAAEKEKQPKIRLGLRGGGCTGYVYIFEWLEELKETDKVFSFNGAEIIIDPKSLIYLEGSTVEFETTIMGRGFKVNSPAAKGTCGCGASITF